MKADLLRVLSHLNSSISYYSRNFYNNTGTRHACESVFIKYHVCNVLIGLFAVALWKVWLKPISLSLKTIVSRVLSRLKQTIAPIKLLIGIGKPGRRTVDNQSRSVLQQFYYVLIKTMALMTLAKSTSAPCVPAWHVYWSLFAVSCHDDHDER